MTCDETGVAAVPCWPVRSLVVLVEVAAAVLAVVASAAEAVASAAVVPPAVGKPATQRE